MAESAGIVVIRDAVAIARDTVLRGAAPVFASLRTGPDGAYRHEGLAERLGPAPMQRALARLHREAFTEWLDTRLEDQWGEMKRHLGEGGCAAYVPGSASAPERQLFDANLRIFRELREAECSETVAGPKGTRPWHLTAMLRRLKSSADGLKVTLRELGEALAVSPNHLGRIFHEQVGLAFHDYMLAARMVRAAHILLAEPWPLKCVAAAVGCDDVSNFCKDFHKAFGETPTSYRRRVAAE